MKLVPLERILQLHTHSDGHPLQEQKWAPLAPCLYQHS